MSRIVCNCEPCVCPGHQPSPTGESPSGKDSYVKKKRGRDAALVQEVIKLIVFKILCVPLRMATVR